MQNHFGLVDNYDDLYQSAFREPLSKGMIIIGIAGYLLSLVPFVTMYTLTEEEHDAHITILKIRAALEDYATDALSDGELEAAKTSYAEAIEEYKQLSSADKLSKKEQRRLKALTLIAEEHKRFEQPKMINKIEAANELLSHTVEELYGISEPTMDRYNAANAMPESTAEEAKMKKTALKEAQRELDNFNKKAYDYIVARKLMKQVEYYENWNKIFTSDSVTV